MARDSEAQAAMLIADAAEALETGGPETVDIVIRNLVAISDALRQNRVRDLVLQPYDEAMR